MNTFPMPRALVALFACASGLSVANVYYAQPLLATLASDFALPASAAGVIIGMTQAGSLLALLLLVPLGDRLPRRQLMLVQLLTLVAALIWVCLAHSVYALLAGMLAVGMLGTAMTQGLIAYAAAACAASERGRVVGAAQSGVVVGLLLARVMAGLIADLGGWRMVYGAAALGMLIMGILLRQALPLVAVTRQAVGYHQLIGSMLTLLRRDRVLQVRGGIALLMFAAFSILWSALTLPLSAAPYHYSHAAIGAFGLVGLAGALAAARAGHWADRGRGQHTSAAALLLLLLSWLPLALTPQAAPPWALAGLILGILLLDLAVQALHVTNQSMIFAEGDDRQGVDDVGAAHGRLVACYMLFYAVGSGAGASAATAIYALAGWHGVCCLGAAVSLCALLFWAATRRLGHS